MQPVVEKWAQESFHIGIPVETRKVKLETSKTHENKDADCW